MPQAKQKNVHASDKQAVESLQGVARRAKFKKRKKLRADAEKITSLKEKAKDPALGYGYGAVSRKKGVSDPRFHKDRKDSDVVKKAISDDSQSRYYKKRRRKVIKEMRDSDTSDAQNNPSFGQQKKTTKDSRFSKQRAKKKYPSKGY